ncbi:MAG: 23S rRNA (uracil(1939)-C(5))-methyltransferase RlmD [Bacteroidia bacterium]
MARRIEPFNADMELIDAASDGRAVARHEGWAIFVEGGVPGDVADVYVFRKQKQSLIGKVRRLHKASEHRVEPPCTHFGDCGGCKWQHMRYEAQIAYKQQQVVNILRRIGKIEPEVVEPILAAPETLFYRNKLEFSFSQKAWIPQHRLHLRDTLDQRVLGYHTPRFFDKVMDIDACLLQTPLVNDIRNELRTYTRERGIRYYDIRENTGFLRNIVFRTSAHTGEIMLILIVADEDEALVSEIFQHLEACFPQITQFIWIHNPKLNPVFNDLPYRVWKGTPYYTEHLGPYQFRIRPVSFFQTNPLQAERLYGVVKDYLAAALPAGRARFRVLYDLYSGTGSIGIFASDLADKIVGIEYVDAAVRDAWENVRINGFDTQRFSFYAGDMKDILREPLVAQEGAPDVIVADPPRQGMDPKVIRQLLVLKAPWIVYVSCKPATQARDMDMLREWYDVVKIRPVDMFPHTAHVENVALLRLRETPREVWTADPQRAFNPDSGDDAAQASLDDEPWSE